jgi:LuxR family transcriptional regulator, maltose regulon positive regulatory protein
MAEPRAGTATRVDASGAEGLLATKLYVPRLQAGFVPRRRLVSWVGEGLARGLLLVCAPAGFGKTSLLADWARDGRRRVAWLSLDAGDNDPARFWRHVVAALDRVEPDVAGRLVPLLGPPAPRSFDGLITALINELDAQPGESEVAFVLDDYHLIEAQTVHGSLAFLLEHRPPRLQFLLSSRADPPLPLARLRARGQLAELRAAELRFTHQEAAAVLREAVGPDLALPEAAVAALAARTEGWVAGLQLAGLSLRGQPDVAGFVESFSGSHRYVLDFLAEEVLDRQPDEVRAFLLATSVLERLSGELCDAVTGRTGSQRLLEQVERANLFLIPLDEVRGWWRYHHLFADLLQARLLQEQPDQAAQLHRSAAAWYERHGLADDAIRHALAGREMVWAARLIERHFDELFYLRGEGATIQRWLAALPAEVTGSRPRLLLAEALLALASGRVEAVETPLDAAEHAFEEAADEPFESTAGRGSWLLNVPATVTTQRAYLAALRGDAEEAASFASRALAEIGEDEWMLESIARWNLALAEWLRGRLAEAERGLSSTVSRWPPVGERGLGAVMRDHLGQVQLAQGRLDTAHSTYQRTLAIATSAGGPILPAAGVGHVGLATVAYQRGELDTALEHLTEGIPLCRQFVYSPPLATGLAIMAWIRQAKGDTGGALEAIGQAEAAAPGPGVTVPLNPVPVLRARLLLVQGDLAAAARWTTERGLGAGDESGYPREPEYLALTRVLLAQGQPGQALPLLRRLHTAAVAQGRAGSLIEIQALLALAQEASGDRPGAVATLTDALTMACHRGYVRVFADEGAPMAGLLGRVIATQRAHQGPARSIPLGYLGRLARSFEDATGAASQNAARATPGGLRLVEPLTERERQVLRLLAAGEPNQQIAEELVVSLDTVKKHVTHVLGKLGAANRTEATARARELGLLP